MKINLTEIPEDFVTRPVEIAGEMCYLIFPPHIGTKWDKQNLIFRSSIWNSEGELISAGFKKFFNWGEQPDLAYTPFSMTANGGVKLLEKIDGSTLIVSQYKGELIARTRGTADATGMENGHEIELLKKKYPRAFENSLLEDNRYSLIFEWVSPENRIVIKYPEPDIYLISIIDHIDYSLMPQDSVDNWADEYLQVKRPKVYTFGSLKEMHEAVQAFQGVEGLCVYCNKDQDIRKVKGVDYLARHRMKDELGSFERVVDFYFTQGQPSFNDFYQSIVDTVDWETAEECRGDASRIVDGMKEVNKIIDGMKRFVAPLKADLHMPRKEEAARIFQAYGDTNRTGMVFSILDGKELKEKDLKRLLYQVLKK
jgi:hypothetical protein